MPIRMKERRVKMNDLSIIIPIHELCDANLAYFEMAVDSVPSDYPIIVSCKFGDGEYIKKFIDKKRPDIIIKETDDENSPTDFCSLVNQAVIGTTWFSVLEFDDEYTPIWFDNVKRYIDFIDDVYMFMPMSELVDYNTQKFIGFGNEAVWASSFSEEMGYIDHECLENYFDFYITGSVINTEKFIEIGGLKPSIKLSFWHEFLLRFTSKYKIYVIPKIGYKHTLGRPNSLLEQYKATMDEKEQEFWINTAKKASESISDEEYEYKP